MFSATISGTIKRILFDNEKDGEKAFLKVVVECKKQFVKEDDIPYNYPVVAIFGHDAAYVREYAGKGHWIECMNCDLDVYRGEDGDEEERISFKCGRVNLLPKALSEAVASTIDEDDDEDDKKKKKKGKGKDDKKGKSRSERRGKSRDDDEDDDDDEDEDENDSKSKKSKSKSKSKDKGKDKGKSKSKAKSRDDDEDDDEDEDYDDDDDDFYDDDED